MQSMREICCSSNFHFDIIRNLGLLFPSVWEGAALLAAGDSVRVSLDWGRRFDNMQQHSGQHLVSALFENRGPIQLK